MSARNMIAFARSNQVPRNNTNVGAAGFSGENQLYRAKLFCRGCQIDKILGDLGEQVYRSSGGFSLRDSFQPQF